MAKFSLKDATGLMADLARAQNHPANSMIDIMTFAGFCNSREELESHLTYYETRALDYDDAKARRAA